MLLAAEDLVLSFGKVSLSPVKSESTMALLLLLRRSDPLARRARLNRGLIERSTPMCARAARPSHREQWKT
jgi:hypothetical protein